MSWKNIHLFIIIVNMFLEFGILEFSSGADLLQSQEEGFYMASTFAMWPYAMWFLAMGDGKRNEFMLWSHVICKTENVIAIILKKMCLRALGILGKDSKNVSTMIVNKWRIFEDKIYFLRWNFAISFVSLKKYTFIYININIFFKHSVKDS